MYTEVFFKPVLDCNPSYTCSWYPQAYTSVQILKVCIFLCKRSGFTSSPYSQPGVCVISFQALCFRTLNELMSCKRSNLSLELIEYIPCSVKLLEI